MDTLEACRTQFESFLLAHVEAQSWNYAFRSAATPGASLTPATPASTRCAALFAPCRGATASASGYRPSLLFASLSFTPGGRVGVSSVLREQHFLSLRHASQSGRKQNLFPLRIRHVFGLLAGELTGECARTPDVSHGDPFRGGELPCELAKSFDSSLSPMNQMRPPAYWRASSIIILSCASLAWLEHSPSA